MLALDLSAFSLGGFMSISAARKVTCGNGRGGGGAATLPQGDVRLYIFRVYGCIFGPGEFVLHKYVSMACGNLT